MNQTSTAIAARESESGLDTNNEQLAVFTDLTPEVFKARIENEQEMRTLLTEHVKRNMREDYHFTNKLGELKLERPMLLQEGTRNICSLFRLHFGEPQIAETWLEGDHYRVRTHIALFNARGQQIASGDAVCSTRESKYAYRKGNRICPECNRNDSIIKGKTQYGGGWVCYTNKGGCGAKFKDDDERITSQQLGRVDNPDKADVENTVLKIAVKRAKSSAVCDVPLVSEIFAPEDGTKPEPPAAKTEKPKTKTEPKGEPKTDPAPAAKTQVRESSVERVSNIVDRLIDRGVDAEDLKTQFLPKHVAEFSDLTEEQAEEIRPALIELINAKIAGK